MSEVSTASVPQALWDDAAVERFVTRETAGALLVFSASWAKPGERMVADLAEIVERHPLPVGIVDVDRTPAVPRRYGVLGVPGLAFVRAGLVVTRRHGEMSRDDIAAWIESVLTPG